MKYVLYTTAQPRKVQPLADWWAKQISKTKGRGEVTVNVVRRVPRSVKIELDHDEHHKFKWDWFTQNFPAGDYDGVIFYFSPYLRRKWKITHTINGSRNPNNRKYPEFWICCDLPQKAKGYDDLLEIHRLLFHEHGHYDEDRDNETGDKLQQESVHLVDYQLKKIDEYHLLVDYTMPNTYIRPFPKLWSKPSQGYGVKNIAWYPRTGRHIGVDFATPVGTPVLAPKDCQITRVGYMAESLGYWCEVKIDDWFMIVCHLREQPKPGNYKQGAIMAYTGDTGFTKGVHCHVEGWYMPMDRGALNKTSWNTLTFDVTTKIK